jgi:hypothetical protein
MNETIVPYFDAALREGAALDVAALRQRYPEVTLDVRAPADDAPAATASGDSTAAGAVPAGAVPAGADTTQASRANR